MNRAQQKPSVAEAILRAVHRQKAHSHSSPQQAATVQRREEIPPNLLVHIKAEATMKERRRLLASDRIRNLLGTAFQMLKPQVSRR